MKEIQIVTAFFDIGRGNMKNFERDVNKYVEYFKFWARMKNKLVVYTDRTNAKIVQKIRNDFHLADQTIIIPIDDVYSLDSQIYQQIEMALSHKTAIDFRICPDNPESWNAKYNYVTYLKPYFVADAVKKNLVDGMVAWVDFGFDHGGQTYMNSAEFDFLWKYDFSSKIHLFAIEEIDDMPVFEIVRTMRAYIAGAIMVAPPELWIEFAELYRQSMNHLTHCGFADDDQTLSVMSYRGRPELFEIHQVDDWFSALKGFGGTHLSIRPKKRYKEYKIFSKNSWNDRDYINAMKWYFKYISGSIQNH